MGRRLFMTTCGSLGDLHPYLAVATGLRQRGHEVTVATSEMYRSKVEAEGLAFHPVRPDLGPLYKNTDAMRRVLDVTTGTEYLVRQLLLPHLEESYEDLLQACGSKDLLVSHPLAYALPLVAEKLRLPWVSVALQPLIFYSLHDPPVLPVSTKPYRIRRLRCWEYQMLFGFMRRQARPWMKPVDELRSRLGLAPAVAHPLFDGIFSPYGSLAWFSRLLAAPQPDWPARTHITGFPFYDRQRPDSGLDSRLSEFLKKGEPPIVFTLGASTVLHAGDFFEQSLLAAHRLRSRAVLLVGPQARRKKWKSLPPTIFVTDYAPFSELLPHAAATVHQGGVGTTAEALRAGRPTLIVPHSHDQPDNAERVARLGVARVLYQKLYTAERAIAELTHLLSDNSYSAKAAAVGRMIRTENGVAAACDALEELAAAHCG